MLDSYGAERLSVIKSVVGLTDLMTRALGTPSNVAQVLRHAKISLLSRLAPSQQALLQRLYELGVAFARPWLVHHAPRSGIDCASGNVREITGATIVSHSAAMASHATNRL